MPFEKKQGTGQLPRLLVQEPAYSRPSQPALIASFYTLATTPRDSQPGSPIGCAHPPSSPPPVALVFRPIVSRMASTLCKKTALWGRLVKHDHKLVEGIHSVAAPDVPDRDRDEEDADRCRQRHVQEEAGEVEGHASRSRREMVELISISVVVRLECRASMRPAKPEDPLG